MADGRVVVEGRYKVVVRVLEHFGREDREEDWRVYEVGEFGIEYLK